MNTLQQKIHAGTAVVTGAGSGLGRALAIELAANGMRVVALGRRLEPLEQTASLGGTGQITCLKIDVADPEDIAREFDRIAQNIAPITLLINNAAVYPKSDFLTTSPMDFMRSVEINLGGVVGCTHAALTQMTASGVGRIVNVSTFADIAPLSGSAAYSVSKGAARIFTRALVADIADRFPDIVVNDWMPGMLATQMGVADGLNPAVAAKWGAQLAMWHDPTLTGTIFEMDREVLQSLSLKRRILNMALLRKQQTPRIVSD
jgi:short-subunit dehydrogenase